MPGIEIKGRSRIANYRHGGRTKKFGGGRTNLLEELGRVEAEPSNRNRRAEISRVHGELNRGYAKGGRAGHAVGSIVKKVIQGGKKIVDKIKKKPKTETWKTLDVPGMPGPHKGKYPAIDKVMKNLEAQKKKGVVNPHYTGKATGGRAGYAIGSLVHAATKAAKKYHKKKKLAEDTKKGKFPETESLTHQKGPYVGDVGSERPGIKRREWGKRPGQKKPDREHVPYERHGAKKGGKADKKWIQKAVNPKHKGYCTPMTKKTCTPRRKALARTFKKKAKTGW